MPHFTVDWFSHNIASWKRVFDSLGRLNTDKPIKALEVCQHTLRHLQLVVEDSTTFLFAQIGSWEGQSACWLLQHVCRSNDSHLTCIDTWAGAEQYGDNANVRVAVCPISLDIVKYRQSCEYFCVQQWGLNEQDHEGQQVLKRFKSNVADIGASNRVTVLQQPSSFALANLVCTQPAAYEVSNSCSYCCCWQLADKAITCLSKAVAFR